MFKKQGVITMSLTHAEAILLDNLFKTIGQNIHKTRLYRKCTLKKLSRRTGLNIATIDKYEMGRTQLHIKDLLKISLALETKLENLIKAS